MTRTLASLLLAVCVVLLPAVALGQDAKVAKPAPKRNFSLTISPLHLFMPMLELTGEYRVSNRFGAAAVLGVGAPMFNYHDDYGVPQSTRTLFLEGGLQARYYVLGSFRHGMQVGLEAMVGHLSVDDASANVTGTGTAVAIGPFVGYKITTKNGFTFDSQLGFQRAFISAEASEDGESSQGSMSATGPLLNLNIGWSF